MDDFGVRMGPCVLAGLYWRYNGRLRTAHQGPILGDHRIYFGLRDLF